MQNYGRGRRQKNGLFLLIFFAVGAIFGAILSRLAETFLPKLTFLTATVPLFHIAPSTLNLEVIRIIVGFDLNLNLLTILGIIIALLLYRKF